MATAMKFVATQIPYSLRNHHLLLRTPQLGPGTSPTEMRPERHLNDPPDWSVEYGKEQSGPEIIHSNPPWETWELDEDFFRTLSRWTLDHPETSLDRILDNILSGITTNRDLFALIPDQPFPARGLVTAIIHLFSLGVAISRATAEIQDFAKSILRWVIDMKLAFDSNPDGRRSRVVWRNLSHTRELIEEICKWAATRLKDGRWLRIKHGLTINKEICEFKTRMTEARHLFMDLSVLNLTAGVDVLEQGLQELLRAKEFSIALEITKIRTCQANQLAHIMTEMENQKQITERRAFLLETLVPHTVEKLTYTHQGKQPCDSGTRVEIMKDITSWIYDITHKSQNFLWLTGDPGCGKSTVTASIARDCKDKQILWGQLFINRKNDETTNPNSYFPSITRQFSDRSPDVQRIVYESLIRQPSLMDGISIDQATKLFVGIIGIASFLDQNSPMVVVIDALDETDPNRLRETATIFSQLFEALREYPNAKVFISSRTEDGISSPFSRTINDKYVKRIHLDTSAQSSINDVELYLKRRLIRIVENNYLDWDVWPRDERVRKLVAQASGLFIWAVTAVRFFEQQIEKIGTECLDEVLDLLNSEGMADINILYHTILHSAYPATSSDWEYEKFRRIVGAIVVLREPLSLADLSSLLDLRRFPESAPADIVNFVRRLRTLLAAGTDAITPRTVPRLHKSFFEFITSKRVDCRFRINQEHARVKLGRQRLELSPQLDSFRMYSSKWETAHQWLDANQADLLNYVFSQESFSIEDKALCAAWVKKSGVIYQRATVYIYKLLKTGHPNIQERADYLVELKDCIQMWTLWNAVQAISQYNVVRDRLRTFPSWRGGEDFQRIIALDTDSISICLYLVLHDREQFQKLMEQPAAQIHAVLNLLQGMLDSLSLDESFKGPFLQGMIKIARDTNLYPDGLLQHDVVFESEEVFPGMYRTIRKGTYKGRAVAIKIPTVHGHLSAEIISEFSGEALLWHQLRHVNVLPLLCLFRGHPSTIALVSPWMENSHIERYLITNPRADRVSLMRDVTKGLEYLHTMQPSIVHGELVPYNILITDAHRACITDFRLSTGYQSETLGLSLPSLTGEIAESRFRAPELISRGECVDCNISSDIYSLGCVLYSVFTGSHPFHNIDNDYAVFTKVIRGERPLRPSYYVRLMVPCESLGLDDNMWNVVEDCWQQDPAARPTTTRILARFPISAPRDVTVPPS